MVLPDLDRDLDCAKGLIVPGTSPAIQAASRKAAANESEKEVRHRSASRECVLARDCQDTPRWLVQANELASKGQSLQ